MSVSLDLLLRVCLCVCMRIKDLYRLRNIYAYQRLYAYQRRVSSSQHYCIVFATSHCASDKPCPPLNAIKVLLSSTLYSLVETLSLNFIKSVWDFISQLYTVLFRLYTVGETEVPLDTCFSRSESDSSFATLHYALLLTSLLRRLFLPPLLFSP